MSESPVGAHAEKLERQIVSAISKAVREVVTAEEVSNLVAELAPPAPLAAADELLAAIGRVDSESSQADILSALVEEASRFAARTAFFLIQAGEIHAWASRGWNGALEELGFEVPGAGAWAELARGACAVRLDAEGCGELARRADAESGSEGILVPFVLRGRLAGALYADRTGVAEALDGASLQLLTHSAAQTLETAALRGRGPSPALRTGVSEDAEPLPLWSAAPAPAEPEAISAETEAAPAFEETEAAPAFESASAFESPVEAIEPPALEEPAAALEEPAAALEPTAFEAVETEAELEPIAAEPVAGAPASDTPAAEAPTPFEPAEPAPEAVEPPVGASAFEPEYGEPVEAPFLEPAAEDPAAEIPTAEAPVSEVPAEGIFETQVAEPPVSDIWEDADDGPTVDEPTVDEPTVDEPTVEPTVIGGEAVEAPEASVLGDAAGQQTVRLDLSDLPPADQPSAAPGTPAAETPEFELEPQASESAGFELEPEPMPVPSPFADTRPSTLVTPPPDLEPPAVESPVVEPPPAVETAPTEVAPAPDVEPADAAAEVAPPFVEPAAAPPVSDVGHPPSFASPPEAPPAATFEPPDAPPPKPASTSTEVLPPDDLTGPGSAFAPTPPVVADSGIPAGEEALHEEARRLARLLVSEIKLYNEEVIEEGRMAGNIYSRLREDIDRSRQMYTERIDPRIEQDYFYKELVQRLAGGDEKLLGM